MSGLRAYEVGVIGAPWPPSIRHALTAGRAKYDYLRSVQESWPDISFKHLTCRLLGGPRTDSEFQRVATYRGVSFARIGMRVEVEGHAGLIVKHNDACNFDVLFTDGPYKGSQGNCHPNWMFKYFDEAGNLIAEFRS